MTSVELVGGAFVTGIAGTSATNVFATTGFRLLFFDGSMPDEFDHIANAPAGCDFYGAQIESSTNLLVACGRDVRRWNGSTFTVVDGSFGSADAELGSEAAVALSRRSDGTLLAAGEAGQIHRYTGSGWTNELVQFRPAIQRLASLGSAAEDVNGDLVVVGGQAGQGTILRFDWQRWSVDDTPTSTRRRTVLMHEGQLWVGSDDGEILRREAGVWTTVGSPLSFDIFTGASASSGLYFGGDGRDILRLAGTTATTFTLPTGETTRSLVAAGRRVMGTTNARGSFEIMDSQLGDVVDTGFFQADLFRIPDSGQLWFFGRDGAIGVITLEEIFSDGFEGGVAAR